MRIDFNLVVSMSQLFDSSKKMGTGFKAQPGFSGMISTKVPEFNG